MMDIVYLNQAYQFSFNKDKKLVVCCDNIVKCKQIFLDTMSKEFDDAVNQKLGNFGFIKKE